MVGKVGKVVEIRQKIRGRPGSDVGSGMTHGFSDEIGQGMSRTAMIIG
jgi:hypothetical protein